MSVTDAFGTAASDESVTRPLTTAFWPNAAAVNSRRVQNAANLVMMTTMSQQSRGSKWIAALALFGLLAGLAWGQSLDFVLVTDTHVMAIDGVHSDIAAKLASKRKSNDNLAGALRAIGQGTPPSFVLA